MTGFDFNVDFSSALNAYLQFGVSLIPTANPRIFSTPSVFLQIAIYHNGRRLKQSPTPSAEDGEYYVFASGGITTGFDRVQFLTFTPNARSQRGLQADLILLATP